MTPGLVPYPNEAVGWGPQLPYSLLRLTRPLGLGLYSVVDGVMFPASLLWQDSSQGSGHIEVIVWGLQIRPECPLNSLLR